MKRVRVLIYDYKELSLPTVSTMMAMEGVQGHKEIAGYSISSIELNPLKITVLQLIRLFGREVGPKLTVSNLSHVFAKWLRG